jgi:hypothetical protein
VKLPFNTRVLYTFGSALIILLGSYLAIQFAQGYHVSKKGVQGTGLLVANSFPNGAELYLNNKLASATDITLYLDPGSYQVEVRKDGYLPWQKTLQIEQGLVTQTNALLFRRVPSLTPLTYTGVKNVSPSPDGQKLLYYTSSASAQVKNGLYLLDLTTGLLSNQKEPRQIAGETPGFDLSTSQYIWSPDNTQVILSSNNKEVLLDLNKMNELSLLPDIGFRKKQILGQWESQLYLRERQFFDKFPDEIVHIATQSAKNVYLSPDKKKILYTATASAVLPENLTPPLRASNTQPEQRNIEPGSLYVYDREEDKNFLLTIDQHQNTNKEKILLANDLYMKEPLRYDSSPSAFQRLQATNSAQIAQNFASFYSSVFSHGIQWFPDSKHILFSDKDKIFIMEYDNTNRTAIYSGPYADNFVYPWPDGSKVIIMTTFSSNILPNLYAIELK